MISISFTIAAKLANYWTCGTLKSWSTDGAVT